MYVCVTVLRLRVAIPPLVLALSSACKPAPSTPPPTREGPVQSAPVTKSKSHPTPPASVDEPQSLIELCPADSDALADARAQFDALDTLVETLDAAASPGRFVEMAQALYAHECLKMGRRDVPWLELEVSTGIEARVHWALGLDMWFRTYLDSADGSDETVWLMPTRRDVVTPLTRPEDPLAPWLCSDDVEDACNRAVAPWRGRAERYFELWSHTAHPEQPDCRELAESASAHEAYGVWRTCEQASLPRQAAMPVGGVGPIEDGWILIWGRRGHYNYCDEVAALDLASGSHYRFADCAHRPEIAEFAKAAGARPKGLIVETSTLPPELLREFAWAAMSVPYVQRDVILETALGRERPDGVAMLRTEAPMSLSGTGLAGWGSSGHTTLAWQWSRGSRNSPAHGELSWPDGLSNPADDHAVRLLALAEQRGVSGCAARKLPRWLLDNLAPDALPARDDERVDPPSPPLLDAMRRQLKRGRCAR